MRRRRARESPPGTSTELAAVGGLPGYPITAAMVRQAELLAQAGYRCERCGRAAPLQVADDGVVCAGGCPHAEMDTHKTGGPAA